MQGAGYTFAEAEMLCQNEQERLAAVQTGSGVRPNIILILNESWFDWRQVTEFETDRPVMPFLDSLENCIRGFSVEPLNCGGTCLSEYELLTSNSLSMMPEITPFTQRDLNGSYSVASYLNDLGCETTALHPGAARNYNRSVAYPSLGFGRVAFVEDDIWSDAQSLRAYVSDAAAVGVIQTLFEEKDADIPALIYLLTIRNHGGYDLTVKNGGEYFLDAPYEIGLKSGFDGCRGVAEEYPAVNAGFCQDRDGNFVSYSYTEQIPQSELPKQYFYFEYNSLLVPEKRIKEIFLAG